MIRTRNSELNTLSRTAQTEIANNFRSFETNFEEDFTKFKKQQETNNLFLINYSKSKKASKKFFKNELLLLNSKFSYLINEYHSKNYKIEKMIEYDNEDLFAETPLLLEGKQIVDVFRIPTANKVKIIKADIPLLDKYSRVTNNREDKKPLTINHDKSTVLVASVKKLKQDYKKLRKHNKEMRNFISLTSENTYSSPVNSHLNTDNLKSLYSTTNFDSIGDSTIEDKKKSLLINSNFVKPSSNKQLTYFSFKAKGSPVFNKEPESIRSLKSSEIETKYARNKKKFAKIEVRASFSEKDMEVIISIEKLLKQGKVEQSKELYVNRLYEKIKTSSIEDESAYLQLIRFYNLYGTLIRGFGTKIDTNPLNPVLVLKEFVDLREKMKKINLENFLKVTNRKNHDLSDPKMLRKLRKIEMSLRKMEQDIIHNVNKAIDTQCFLKERK